jgi:hypothetical protein
MVSATLIGHRPFLADGTTEGYFDAVPLAQQLAGCALEVPVAYLVCGVSNGQQRRRVGEGRRRRCSRGHISASKGLK